MSSLKKWRKFAISDKWMKYKTFTRSRKIKSIKREVRKIYRKTIGDNGGIRKKKLLFKAEG